MDDSKIDQIIRHLQEMSKDLRYLRETSDSELPTSDMAAYKNQIKGWLEVLFSQVGREVDKYMSSLAETNPSGFLRPEAGENPSRVLSNFQHLEERRTQPAPPTTSYKPQGHSTKYASAPTPRASKNYDSALLDGMAAGYYVLQDPANNVLIDDDYFNKPYEDSGDDVPEVDIDTSVAFDDVPEDSFAEVIDEDMPLF